MNSEDKFRELLKQKLGEKEFSFNPDKWEKAKDLIDASRARKKKRGAMILWSLLLLTLGTSVLLLNLPEKAGKIAVNTPSRPTIVEPNTTMHAPILSGSAAEKTEKTSLSASQQPATAQVMTHAPVVPQDQTVTEPTTSKRAMPSVIETKQHTPAEAHTTSTKPEAPAANTTKSTRQQPNVGIDVSEPANNTIAGTPVATKDIAEPEAKPVDQVQPGVAIESGETPPIAETATGQPLVPAVEAPVAADEMSVAETLSVAVKDTVAATPVATGVVLIQEPVWLKHVFFAEAGINGLLGWQAPQKRDAQGVNPIAGLGYIHMFSHDKGLSFGIQYTSIGHLGAYSHTSTVTRMGFGEEKTHTVITPTKLHYLAFPIRLQVNMDDNNTFGLGYTLAWLLTSEGKKDIYEQQVSYISYEQPVSYTSHTTSKVKGYTRGFSTFDSQLSVFYRRKIYKDFSANAEFLFGLTDVKDNKFFGAGKVERNMGLKITLIYHLFKK